MEKKDFRPYLEPDEYVVWQGKPEKGNYFRQEDIFRVPFGLFFFGFAVVWAAMASQADVGFSLFASPFMAAGLYTPRSSIWTLPLRWSRSWTAWKTASPIG